MTDEVWKEINGYPSYMISDKGRVKNCMRNKILKPGLGKSGYLHVGLWKDGTPTYVDLHRMVAEYFIPNPDNLPVVEHIDDIKTHNWKDNLKWSTQLDNVQKAFSKMYSFISPTGEVVRFNNLRKFCREHNLTHGPMGCVHSGKPNYNQHKGWRKHND